MNGISVDSLPKFLEGEALPRGYFELPNPYIEPPTRKINLGALVTYARNKGKKCWDLTKEEVRQFEPEKNTF